MKSSNKFCYSVKWTNVKWALIKYTVHYTVYIYNYIMRAVDSTEL